jgi:hypothetical protein
MLLPLHKAKQKSMSIADIISYEKMPVNREDDSPNLQFFANQGKVKSHV